MSDLVERLNDSARKCVNAEFAQNLREAASHIEAQEAMIADLIMGLEWAVSEIGGSTIYTEEGQYERCLELAEATLSKATLSKKGENE